jgi:hypothetical protein
VQYWNFIEPIFGVPTAGRVNWKKWLTRPPAFEPPSKVGDGPVCKVKLLAVIWLAEALLDITNENKVKRKRPKPNLISGTIGFPLMLIYEF